MLEGISLGSFSSFLGWYEIDDFYAVVIFIRFGSCNRLWWAFSK